MQGSYLKHLLSILSISVIFVVTLSCSEKKDDKPDTGNIESLRACTTGIPEATQQSLALEAKDISVMEFNIENLFDDVDDPGIDDETYLPKAVKDANPELQAKCNAMTNEFYKKECLELDWSSDVIAAKVKNIASTVLTVENGKGPDVLLLEEVENINALNKLRDGALQAAGYQTTVLIEGFDTRGIDVALMSRLPLRAEPTLHKIPFVGKDEKDQKGMDKSRGILEVPLKPPDGAPLTVFVLHFPSQSNPRYWREQAVQHLIKLMKDHEGEFTIAGGDFNISGPEEKEAQWFKKNLSEVGMVSHIVGCAACQGTYYYKKDWEYIDALVFGGRFLDKNPQWQLDVGSIEVLRRNPIHMTNQCTPLRFDPETKTGISDHLPVFARISPN